MILLLLLSAVIATFRGDKILSPHYFCLKGPEYKCLLNSYAVLTT